MTPPTFSAREAITQTRVDGRQRDVSCPAHEDRRASLSVGRGEDGQVLLHCHTGCSLDAILGAAGLTRADLMPEHDRTQARRIVATYRYEDEHGTHLYDVVRYAPKDFRQRRADGAWSMAGVRRVVYRLQHLAGQDAVFVVEGEKDADALAALGLPATCNPGGAGKWRAEYAGMLRAAGCTAVVILPDNDVPGRQHAADVAASCHAAGLTVRVLELPHLPAKGDVADWLRAGGTADALRALADACPTWAPTTASTAPDAEPAGRRVTLVTADTIPIRPVRWLWDQRMALGSFGLLGGREGIGKSICAYTLAAEITRGRLPGHYHGTPRDVVIVATEDSKAHTIVPRLMAAGADLARVHFVHVTTSEGTDTDLVLPVDVPELARAIADVDAVLVLFDPLLSRLDANLDSHKDAEARRALEPLARLADTTGACFLGLIHVNKTTTSDPLTMLMASRAFAAVARWVLFAMMDPDDDQRRLLGLAKTNLGRPDLPTLAYRIVPAHVATTDEGDIWTGRLDWLGEADQTIRDAIRSVTSAGDKSAATEAAEWLSDYLVAAGGSADSAEIRRAGAKTGHTADHLRRAREKLRLQTLSVGFPRTTRWVLRDQSGQPVPTSLTTAMTATTGDFSNKLPDCQNEPVMAVAAVVRAPARGATTAATEVPAPEMPDVRY